MIASVRSLRHRPARLAAPVAVLLAASGPAAAATFTNLALHPPAPDAGDLDQRTASQASLFDLGSTFLSRIGNQVTWGTNAAGRVNPEGGGAPAAAAPQMFRAWGEGYGLSARTDPQGDFAGDRRKTFGGVIGLAATPLPGWSFGVTVDGSTTRIDMPLAQQSGRLDLTQLGLNAAYSIGAWTLSAVYVHGWGDIRSSRQTVLGPASAGYRGSLDGVLGEVSYFHGIGQGRLVPKLGVEYVRAATDAFRETGGFVPVSAAAGSGERLRVLLGAEVGHFWRVDQTIIDLAGYGKFVDNAMQNLSPVTISANGQSVSVQGITESRLGADAGAGASLILSRNLRFYGNYDGKFRQNFVSHQGTIGVEVKW
jgi:outer membrane autotransporter protein